MPRRQVANYDFGTIATLSSGSTNGTWTYLGAPFTRFTITGIYSTDSTGTVQLHGASSSGSTAAMTTLLATISNTTQMGYNSTAIACTWVRARLSDAISTGTVTCNLLASAW